jgi:hypothetical protein
MLGEIAIRRARLRHCENLTKHLAKFARSSFMEYRGVNIQIVRAIERKTWKWTVQFPILAIELD